MLAVRFIGVGILLSLCLPLLCKAGGLEYRLWRSAGKLHLRFNHEELFQGSLEKRLDSGFELLVSYRLELLGKGQRKLASTRITIQAVYDLWNERYVVHWSFPEAAERELVTHRTEALRLLRRIDLSLPEAGNPGEPLRLELTASLRPASTEQTETARQWLLRGQPSGAAADARGTNLFTLFASLFITPVIEETDRETFVVGPWTLDGLPTEPPPEGSP